MTEQELAALEELAKAAGPQRWVYQDVDSMAGYRIVDDDGLIVMGHHGPEDYIARFCAALNPQQALALVAEVRRLRALVRDAFVEGGVVFDAELHGDDCGGWEGSDARKALGPSDGVAR
jgi:hypothetical protein